MTARFEIADGGDDARVGRRAAVSGAAVTLGDDVGLLPGGSSDAPDVGAGFLVQALDAGADLAGARAQIGAKPGHDEGYGFSARQRGCQLIHGDGPIGAALARVDVFRCGRAVAGGKRHGVGRIDELARAGDEDDAFDLLGKRLDGAINLERQLRQAVAMGRQQQALKDDVGGVAKGGRVAGPLMRLDEAVGSLRS